MKNNTQSRKWQITINNPMEEDFSHKRIKQQFSGLKSLVYFCILCPGEHSGRKSKDTKRERETLIAKLDSVNAAIDKLKNDSAGLNEFIVLIEKYTDIQSLDSAIAHELIEKIAVYQSEKIDGQKERQIDIYYRFIGKI